MLLSSLAENLLTLLVYDKERAPIIRNVIEPALYGGIYRELALRVYDHLDRFKAPPGDHLPDLLADKLEGDNKREAGLYIDVVDALHAAKDGVNGEYVMSQVETFVRRQSLRTVAIDLAKALQRDTNESLDEAEKLLAGANRVSMKVFDAGTRLSDHKRALKFLDAHTAAFPLGIPELDKRGFGPTRKEMWLFLGNTKAGKTWALIQLAKVALLQRLKVLHITLEMSEDRCAQRYYQALWAIAKRKETVKTTKFERDDLGRITGFEDVRVMPKLTFDDPEIRKKLERRIQRYSTRMLDNIFIKQFATGQLTLGQLRAYMDHLEHSERFVPDLVLLDYPDLMKQDTDNLRVSLDHTMQGLRGIAVERNMAMAVVSQSNRAGAKSKQLDATAVAEAYSKIAHADTTITYSQSKQERKMGLARLFVAAGRNDEDKITVVVSQSYTMGQFALDSSLMVGNYFDNLPAEGAGADDE